MDKLSLISGALFLAADIFAVAALAMPDWIVTDVGGETRLGLIQVPREAIIKISHQFSWDLSSVRTSEVPTTRGCSLS